MPSESPLVLRPHPGALLENSTMCQQLGHRSSGFAQRGHGCILSAAVLGELRAGDTQHPPSCWLPAAAQLNWWALSPYG